MSIACTDKVVVTSGGSIAGPAIAWWLNRYGFKTTLVERWEGLSPGGQNINRDVAKTMDIETAVLAADTGETGTIFTNLYGTTKVDMSLGVLDFAKLLYDQTCIRRNGVSGISSVAENENEVKVGLQSGRGEEFDLVVIADRVGSWTRKDGFRGLWKLGIYDRCDPCTPCTPCTPCCDDLEIQTPRPYSRIPWHHPKGYSSWINEPISTPSLVPALILQAFATGILDATTYADFRTFASNQTGNTILLTVAVIDTEGFQLLLTGVSLGSFLLGAMMFGHLGHFMGTRRRLWLLISTTIQTLLLLLAALLLSPIGPSQTQIGSTHEWSTLFLFAFMSGIQVAQARQSGSQELPTAPMTSSLVDLVSDKYLFCSWRRKEASGRNKRLAYVVVMVVGGFVGAGLHRAGGSWVVVLVCMGLKLGVLGMMVLMRGMRDCA